MNKHRVLFIGSKALGYRVLREIFAIYPEGVAGCVTIKDKDDTRSCYKQFEDFCKVNSINMYIYRFENDLIETIDKENPEICIVVGWYYLISSKLLSKVSRGFWGIHNSLLPRYRGHAPAVWAMINGDREIGYSAFSFSVGMDEGDIWFQGEIIVDQNDYIADVLNKIEESISIKIREEYLAFLDGKIKSFAQIGQPSYCAKRTPLSGHINWKRDNIAIYNFIRAQAVPYPGAFAYWNEQKIVIWKVKLFEYTFYGEPGQVGQITQDGVIVVCGDNTAIILQEIEISGCTRKAETVLNSLSIFLT